MTQIYLKWKLKRLYLKIKYGFEDYDCGHKILLDISSRYYDLCVRFNETANKLSQLDKNCPKFRYELI